MPMFKALKACPDAVVIKPDFEKYTAASRQVRALMAELTPLVQPLSIDEAVLDLAGTEALHGAAPAVVLARFAAAVEQQVGITVSIGLAANRLMAKIAAGRGKPRGFTVIDAEEAAAVLAPESVRLLPGVGAALARKLETLGITRLGQLQALPEREAVRKLGDDGPALVRRARGLGRTRGRSRAGSEIGQRGNHVRPRPVRHRRPGTPSLAPVRETGTPPEGTRTGRRRRGAEAENRRVSRCGRARRGCPARRCCPTGCSTWRARCWRRKRSDIEFRLIGIGANPLVPGSTADLGDLADPDHAQTRRGTGGDRRVARAVRRRRDRPRPFAALTDHSAPRIGIDRNDPVARDCMAQFAASRSGRLSDRLLKSALARVFIHKISFISAMRNGNCNVLRPWIASSSGCLRPSPFRRCRMASHRHGGCPVKPRKNPSRD